MFCYQPRFDLPTRVITEEQFWALVKAPQTAEKVKEARSALERGDRKLYDRKKKGLPLMVFIGTFEESSNGKGNYGCWRTQRHVNLNGLVVADYDHLEGDVRQLWEVAYARLSDEYKARIMLVFVTPSGAGLKVVFTADVNVGNLFDNVADLSAKLGFEADKSGKDGSRGAFMTTEKDIISINKELFTYENKAFAEKFNAEYRAGHSAPTKTAAVADKKVEQRVEAVSQMDAEPVLTYHNVPYQKIVAAWVGDKKIEQGDRHRTSLVLADHLRYITDNDAKLIELILKETPFVKEIIEERNEDVATTVKSAQGYDFLKGIPKRMQQALKAAGANSIENGELKIENSAGADNDVYAVLPLEEWAEELQGMVEYYPCLKELFLNVHPHKLPAVWFSSAALFGTLMTRAWYHFWYEPEIVRRLNYSIFIIGDPGAGKNIVEKFYKKIADPMIQSDKCLIDAVNRYKEGRTERTTSTKAQKGEALKRPVVGIRVHPARTATGEFIRHMNAAIETVQGVPLNLHMFSFDAELDNVTKQNKGGDWKDREILELKAFHNEEDGQMYANQ